MPISNVVINGKRYDGVGSITTINGKVYIDGVLQEDAIDGSKGQILKIEVEGVLDHLKADAPVVVHGEIKGNVEVTGPLTCGHVGGSIKGVGPINCGNIAGNVNTIGPVNRR